MLTAPDTELAEWRERIRCGNERMVREQQLSLIDEVVRLRRAIRRVEKQLLVATQMSLFQEEGK
jgi:hypothetical protein